MPTKKVSRESVIRALVAAIEPLEYVHALWEGGAVAFDRLKRRIFPFSQPDARNFLMNVWNA